MDYEISVDLDLEDIIPMFLQNRKKDLSDLRDALIKNDSTAIQYIGHSLKGVGGGYGFTEVTNIGKLIEEKAKSNDLSTMSSLFDQLEYYLDHVKITYVEEE